MGEEDLDLYEEDYEVGYFCDDRADEEFESRREEAYLNGRKHNCVYQGVLSE